MKRFLLALISVYRTWISPALPGSCRYLPSCSLYALEAIEVHGAARGSFLAAGRLLRCHPLGRSGYDPVPGIVRREEAELPGKGKPASPDDQPDIEGPGSRKKGLLRPCPPAIGRRGLISHRERLHHG
ncbi:MAG: membrane protein insertion efficiency factor YidD [bacterium]|nr:MAG: membrane protein insertion efficiency factor YidD [bacterium]